MVFRRPASRFRKYGASKKRYSTSKADAPYGLSSAPGQIPVMGPIARQPYGGGVINRKNQLSSEYCALVNIVDVQSDTSGVIEHFIPLRDISNVQNLDKNQALWDQYRVIGVSIQYVATRPNDIASGTEELVNYWHPIYQAYDLNTNFSAGPTTVDETLCLRYESTKFLPAHQGWKRFLKMNTIADKSKWFAMDMPGNADPGTLFLYSQGWETGKTLTYGVLIVTYHTVMRSQL